MMNTTELLSDNMNASHANGNNYSEIQFLKTFAPQIPLIERISFPLAAIIGIPGSLFSIIVWSSRPMRRGGTGAAAVYQASLGVVDFCFFLIFVNWYLHMSWQIRVLDYPVVCELFAVINYFIQYLSPTLALAFTLERYLAICHPFRSQTCMLRSTGKGALIFTGILALFCLSTAAVQALFYTCQDGSCTTRPVIDDETSIESKLYMNWTILTEVLFFFCLPITCLILNIFVLQVLRRSVKAKKHQLISESVYNSNGQSNPAKETLSKGSRSSTLTLLCTSFYLICAHLSVATAVLIFRTLARGDEDLSNDEIRKDPVWTAYFRFLTIRCLIESFAMTHYAAKFPIYLATSKQFRQEFCRIFCHRSPTIDRFEMPNYDHDDRASLRINRLSLSKTSGATQLNYSSIPMPRRRPRSTHDKISNANGTSSLIAEPVKRRPSPGLSRTVLGANGERVSVIPNHLSNKV